MNDDNYMSSPKKISAVEKLNNRKSSSGHELSKSQVHSIVTTTTTAMTTTATTNNGFLKRNSSSLDASSGSNDREKHLEEENNSNSEKAFLLNISSDFLPKEDHNDSCRKFQECSDGNVNTIPVPISLEKNLKDSSYLLPLDIVVLDSSKCDKTFEKEDGHQNSSDTLKNNEVLNLQDLRIRENPIAILTEVSTQTSGSISSYLNFGISSRRKSTSVSYKKSKKFWNRERLFKYLMTLFGVVIMVLSIIYLIFFYKTQCLGSEKRVCLSEECVRTASSLLAAMDLTANPCHDFFQYACGTWNKKHVIPEDRSSISTFEIMADQLQVILKDVLEEPFQEHENNNSATRKAKLFYRSCMDIQQIRKIGDAPLKEVLKSLGGWPVATKSWKPPNFSIETLLGKLRGDFNEGVLIEQWVGPDDKNSSVHILQLDQMQLALPSRDYYLKSSSNVELRAYHKYMTQIAVLLGADEKAAEAELEDVVKFEIQLANATLPEADRHDTSAIYRKLSLVVLQKEIPQLNWKEYLSTFLEINFQEEEPVVTYAMPYFKQMGQILKKTDKRVIHNYVIWRLIMKILPHMIDEYQQKIIEFRKILLGILSERHRWSQCVEWTNKKLGMAVGALFIRDNFNQDSKETALEMIHTIREAFNELLTENIWMDDETRAVAKEKADSMNERIGYPELLTDAKELNQEYMNLTITENQFLVNVLNVLKYDAYHNLRKLRQPVNKDKWSTEPAVVNAFYNPNKNDIVFPAGILQPLFYSQHFPKSLNYGGIGVVIGHEITHGFDDKGRQFDKDGNMMQWWNNATIKAFRERTQCIIDQYSRYKLDEIDLFVNGRMTQGENIADNGGLKQSFRAYKKWVAKHGEEPLLPGINLTHDQLFFLNYAQIWCGSMRPEDALTKIRSSVHSPGPVRVLGPLSNSWDFAEAYKCPLKSPMNPSRKCSVW